MNVAVALGVLLVGIVSFWMTTRISGLEDYFRSEISRRNSDLNGLAQQARHLGQLADERQAQLANLQTSAQQITASNLAAQGKLLSTQGELSRLGLEVSNAKQTLASSETRLASLASQSTAQERLIDLFRRQRFFESAHLRILLAGLRSGHEAVEYDGEELYNFITNWPVGELQSGLGPYLADFEANARSTCQWIRSYKPAIPPQQPYPAGPKMPGTLADNDTFVRMTQRELQEWNAAQAEWSRRYTQVSNENSHASKIAEATRDYLSKASASCVCQALATAENSASAICPGYERAPGAPNA